MTRLLLTPLFFAFLSVFSFAQKSLSSPGGWVVDEKKEKSNRTWYFCQNGNIQMTEDIFPEKSVYQGSWEQEQNKIKITLTINYGKRGIGDAWVVDGQKGFNTYSEFVHKIDKKVTLDLEAVQKKSDSLRDKLVVVKTGYQCPSHFYAPQLPGRYPIASYRILTEKDLKKLKPEELEVMRNEIYARYGYKFLLATLKEYFDQQDWYIGDKTSVDNYLTSIEKRNIRKIAAWERSHRK